MENKEIKKTVPVELDDEALDDVIGGASLDEIRGKCTQLGIDFDALYADVRKMSTDLEPHDRVAEKIILMTKNAWEWSRVGNWYGATDIVNALREKYPHDP